MVLDHVGLMIGVTGDHSSQARASAWYCRGVGFLKEFVKLNWFPSGLVRNASAWRGRLFLFLVGGGEFVGSWLLHFSGFVSVGG